MNPNKALWEKGDFTRIAEGMRDSGEALINTLGITKGLKVLDLGCGDGTTALPAAKLGAEVVGVDIAGNLVEAGNRRAKALGLRDTYNFNYPSPPSDLVAAFRKFYGPTMNAFEAAERNGRSDDLQKELEDLFNRQNTSPRKDATSIPATFLRVTVAR